MSEEKKLNVLIVDDSAFIRKLVSDTLGCHPSINIVGTAANGQIAVNLLNRLKPDIIVLDVDMPVMNGLDTMREINKIRPTPVIMLSSLTKAGAQITIKAFELGIVDFITKPDGQGETFESIKESLITKVLAAGKILETNKFHEGILKKTQVEIPFLDKKLTTVREKTVIIGSSTGGPQALKEIIPYIPYNLPARVIIVQHMPSKFTGFLAQRLDKISQISIKEAKDGDFLETSKALVAPGNFHLVVDDSHNVKLNQNPPVKSVRPSVDVTLTSAAKIYGEDLICVILTGMGSDGTNGAAVVKEHKGYCIAEDKSTSLIYGMPKSVIDAGYADEILPLSKIANGIVEAVYR